MTHNPFFLILSQNESIMVTVHRFGPALARLDVHSRHDRAECYAMSFYTMGQGSQAWARVHRSGLGNRLKMDPRNFRKKCGFATTLPSAMFQTRPPRLSCTERAYPKRSAMAGRFVGMWKRSVFLYKTFTKWRMVMRIQPLNP